MNFIKKFLSCLKLYRYNNCCEIVILPPSEPKLLLPGWVVYEEVPYPTIVEDFTIEYGTTYILPPIIGFISNG